MNDLLGSADLAADGVERLREVITRSGAPRRIEAAFGRSEADGEVTSAPPNRRRPNALVPPIFRW
ncbi:hypothetical protein [Streptomyces sp. CBMA123]|uniref:hypothetical protein n=1 Tax=Streptomyces sp. CBMA123 TaxID=1896313 RepID=UPI001661DB20|nr:hypothetical protein [Streptomyces sp. CBMA123]